MAYKIYGLPILKVETIEKSFNVFYQELSPQGESLDTRVAVSRQTVYTFNRSDPRRQKYEVPEKYFISRLVSPGMSLHICY